MPECQQNDSLDRPVCWSDNGAILPQPTRPSALLPGSFNPLHEGHLRLAAVASAKLGRAVSFELSIVNVDKPPLADDEVQRRVSQFRGRGEVWVTQAPRFMTKAELFPGSTFVLGWDTAVRLIDPRYYDNDLSLRDWALERLLELGCRMLVAGRVDATGDFQVWQPEMLPARYQDLTQAIPATEFRLDLSSTALRQQLATLKPSEG